MLHNLKHNKVLHEKVVILTVKFLDVPHTNQEERISVEAMLHEFYRITVRYGSWPHSAQTGKSLTT